MTPQEKAKLFKAIGYQENSSPTELPEHYVAQCLEFELNSLQISIKSEVSGGSPILSSKSPLETILLLQLKNVGCKFQQRPSAAAIK
jgi:vacuolar protein sorting-associated protein 13A/C